MDVNALVKKVTSGAQGNHGTMSTVMGLMGVKIRPASATCCPPLTAAGWATT